MSNDREVITLRFTRAGLQGLIDLINNNDTRSLGFRVTVRLNESRGEPTLDFQLDQVE